MSTNAPRDHLVEWALFHATLGWPVFPIRPGDKRPAYPDHPAHHCLRRDPWCRTGHTGWEQRATTDPGRIRRAWARAPFNIGIACGPARLLVIDLDADPDRGQPGWEALAQLATDRQVTVPATFTVTTPSGGRHLYFTLPPGVRLRNTRDALGPNIDTRAAGGYVVAAGSIRQDGHYALSDDTDPIELPAWILQALLERPATATTAPAVRAPARGDAYAAAALTGELERVTAAGNGQHNTVLSTAAYRLGQLAGAGLLDPEQAKTQLRAAAEHLIRADCGCTPREVDRVIAAGLAAGLRRPRTPAERPVA